MTDTYSEIKTFLEEFCGHAELNLQVEAQPHDGGCVMNFAGPDAPLLSMSGGEVLDAFQHIIFQSFIGQIPSGQRVTCDAEGYRATREAELRVMARHAAQRVRNTGTPFLFGPMSAEERRAIHMHLAEESDLQTESTGMGQNRRLQVKLKR